eukprot:CAMPEP_0206385122 /NCGR_PEP_ID=MMETSP0294-20121207/15040_1 /ASSEMBLY_ACC=CAM_ASM_000327 /TAXON_ID=39354 /ORGANISM="Heterosigma akashiwo, Strain CCMP2393" /LENGTH=50 /DNA_ID=CAMNT_0053835679 /DNA_START=1 /DNA_END=153 /DNA_ORIENTATION=+
MPLPLPQGPPTAGLDALRNLACLAEDVGAASWRDLAARHALLPPGGGRRR